MKFELINNRLVAQAETTQDSQILLNLMESVSSSINTATAHVIAGAKKLRNGLTASEIWAKRKELYGPSGRKPKAITIDGVTYRSQHHYNHVMGAQKAAETKLRLYGTTNSREIAKIIKARG